MKTKLICLVFLFSFLNIFAKVDLKEETASFTVRFSSVDYLIESNRYYLKNVDSYNFWRDSISDEIRFFVALPNSQANPQIIVKEEKVLNSKPNDISFPNEYQINSKLIGSKGSANIFLISIAPIKYNLGDIVALSDFEISFSFSGVQYSPNRSAKNKISFYPQPININQAVYFSEIGKKKIAKSKESFFKINQKYIKLKTRKDGVAFITSDEIFEIAPEWKGKPISNFRLFNNGEEQGLYFANSNDIISDGDTIYFLGKRPIGENAYYDLHSSFNSFFLFYDKDTVGIVNQTIDGKANENLIEYVERTLHYEKDVAYLHYQNGKYLHPGKLPGDTLAGETWYWASLNYKDKDKNFQHQFILPKSSGTVNFNAKCFGGNYINFGDYKNHNTAILLNGDTLLRELSDSIKHINLNAEINSQNLFGNTLFELYELGNPLYYKLPNYTDQIWFDYFNLKGKFAPIAENNSIDFEIDSLSDDSKIIIDNLSHKRVIGIDSVGKSFKILNAVNGDYAMNYASSSPPFLSLKLNDSIIICERKQGVQIAYLEDGAIVSTFFDSYNSATNYLKNISKSAFLVISANIESAPNQDFINELQPFYGELNLSQFNKTLVAIGANGQVKLSSNIDKSAVAGFIENLAGKKYQANLYLGKGSARRIFINDSNAFEKANIELVNNFDLRNQAGEYLIIYHPRFKKHADSLARYREKTHNIKTLTVNVEDIYNDFDYGKKSYQAIKNYLKYAYENWTENRIKWLVLVGDACYDSRKLQSSTTKEDLVPTYGKPATDYWYGIMDDSSLLSEFIVARLPFQDTTEANIYFNKLLEFENSKSEAWKKTFLSLTGGATIQQRFDFANIGIALANIIEDSPICAQSIHIAKNDDQSVSEEKAREIRNKIDQGAFWVNFFGHGAPNVFDMDGWNASYLNNKGKYSLFTSFSCNTGDFALENSSCRSEEYIFEQDAGFISAISSTSLSEIGVNASMLSTMLYNLKTTNIREIGEFLYKSKSVHVNSDLEIIALFNDLLLGEPLCKIPIDTAPNYYMLGEEIFVKNLNGDKLIFEDDSLALVSGWARNVGLSSSLPSTIRLISSYKDSKDVYEYHFDANCGILPFEFEIPVSKKIGKHSLEIIIDPDSLLGDVNYSNNSLTINFEVFSRSALPLEPLSHWNIDKDKPYFRFINPKFDTINYIDEFKIFEEKKEIYSSNKSEVKVYPEYIDFIPNSLTLNQNINYHIKIFRQNKNNPGDTNSQFLPFYADVIKIDGKSIYKLFNTSLKDGNFEKTNFADSNISLIKQLTNFEIKSCTGGVIEGKNRGVKTAFMQLGNDTIINDNFIFGISLALINSETGKYSYKFFETFPPDENGIANAKKCVEYLKDSVKNSDYVMLASSGLAFKVFIDDADTNSSGSYFALSRALRNLGAKKIDSIGEYSSYSLFTFRGASNSDVLEDYKYFGDTSEINGDLNLQAFSGTYSTKEIGPAKAWKYLKIIDNSPSNKIKTQIFGINLNGQYEEIISAKKDSINLEFLDAKTYPYIKIVCQFDKEYINQILLLNQVKAEFTPCEEIALLSEKCELISKDFIKGDTAFYKITAKNLSMRENSNAKQVKLIANNSLDIIPIDSTTIIKADSVFELTKLIETELLGSPNEISTTIDFDNKYYELYKFNNRIIDEFFIKPDTIQPNISAYFDGVLTKNGDKVSLNPQISVVISDNSKLKYQDIDYLLTSIRFNAKIQDTNVRYSVLNESIKKVKFDFTPKDSLEYENDLIVMSYDKSGNKDTLILRVYLARNSQFGKYILFPNPTLNQINIKATFQSYKRNVNSDIEIFNLNGEIINSFNRVINIGENLIEIPILDKNGANLPSGIYYIRINPSGEDYFESIFEKIIIIN